jgi:hypothetical protein
LALTARDAQTTGADLLNISDPLTWYNFNRVMTHVLLEFENKREAAKLKVQLQGIACILGAKPEDFNDDDED